jgi:hypothetical protein
MLIDFVRVCRNLCVWFCAHNSKSEACDLLAYSTAAFLQEEQNAVLADGWIGWIIGWGGENATKVKSE